MTEVRWGSATDIGMVRKKNDDQFLTDPPLFAVADGMGGAKGGDVASLTAVEALRASFGENGDAEGLVAAVQAANRAVFERAGDPALRGMGTTMTALALMPGTDGSDDDEVAVVNVGDSRGYLLRDGDLQQLTEDHNVPGELLKRGELTREEAAVHPKRNLITRVLGVEEDVEVDVWQLVPYVGDRYLLASDGLFGEVPDAEVAKVLRTEADPEAACRTLVDMARAAGGHDNITAVIVDVVDDGGRSVTASKALARSAKSKKKSEDPPTEQIPVVNPAAAPDDLLADAPDPEPEPDVPVSVERKRRPFVRFLILMLLGAAIGAGGYIATIWYFAQDTEPPRSTTTTTVEITVTTTMLTTTTTAPPPLPAPAPGP